MAYIICEPCVDTCDTACVEVWGWQKGDDPVGHMLYIDPEECIDCGACEPECPVEAIFEEDAVPDEWKKFIKINYDFFGREYSG
jgi:ferredoxin